MKKKATILIFSLLLVLMNSTTATAQTSNDDTLQKRFATNKQASKDITLLKAKRTDGNRQQKASPRWAGCNTKTSRHTTWNSDNNRQETPNKAIRKVNFIANMCNTSMYGSSESNGIYTLSTTNLQPQSIVTDENLEANAGGAFDGNTYYYQRYGSGSQEVGIYEYDMAANQYVKEGSETRHVGYMAVAGTAYDKTTRRGYGIYYHESGYPYEFAYIDYNTWQRTTVATIDMSKYTATATMAAHDNGNIYAIGLNNGNLYKVDKQTGEYSLIGETGISVGTGRHRSCIDSKNNKLYWTAHLSDGTYKMIETDLTTAHSTVVGTVSSSLDISTIAIEENEGIADAPACVSGFEAQNSIDKMNDFNVSFNLPTTTFAGNPLTGTVEFELLLDHEYYTTGQGTPGQNVLMTLHNVATGSHELTVVVKNSAGESPEDTYTIWSGPDNTAAPRNAKLQIAGDKATITWEAPDMSGVHGGLVDPAKVRYAVMRLPEQTIVAQDLTTTQFTETIDANRLRFYTYLVVSTHQGMQSSEAATNTLQYGEYIEPPYFENFSDFNTIYLYTVIDANNDDRSWGIGNQSEVGYIYSETNRADDWLITPPLKLQAGKQYKLSFKASCDNEDFPERLEVKMGKDNTAQAMTTELFAPFNLTSATYKTFETTFSVADDDLYYIGFHAISNAFCYYIWMTDLSIETAETAAPAPPTVDIENDADGQLGATLHITAPTTTAGGNPLSEITRMEVVRQTDGKLVDQRSNVGAGTSYNIHDSFDSEGRYVYSVVAYNQTGRGEATIASTFVGKDSPAPPQNVRMVDMGDNTAKLVWDPANGKGQQGGYANPENVRYHVYPIVDGYVRDYVSDQAENTFDPQLYDINTGQMRLVQYMVSAYNEIGESEMVIAGFVAGKKQPLPFEESVKSRSLEQFWYFDRQGEAAVSLSALASDNDGGSIALTTANKGDRITLTSGKIDMAASQQPRLTFKHLTTKKTDAKLTVSANIEQNDDYDVVVKTIDLSTTGGNGTWTDEVVELTELAETDYSLLKFTLEANEATELNIDEIRVFNSVSNDFAAELAAPRAAKVNKETTVSVVVANMGEEPSDNYTVKLIATYPYTDAYGYQQTRNLTLAQEQGTTIAAYGGKHQHTFSIVPTAVMPQTITLKAVVEASGDRNKANNESLAEMIIMQNKLPAIDDLTADTSADPVVRMDWTAPDAQDINLPQTTTEDFEDTNTFPPYSIGGISENERYGSFGNWQLYDGDGQTTYMWQYANNYANAGERMAWQVFNPDGPFDLTASPSVKAHSGSQYLISMCPVVTSTIGNAASDWLISPELSGDMQVVSFFCKAYTDQYGAESYEVLYSETDNNPNSFVHLDNFTLSTTSWTENSVVLPEGAKHFALHHDAFDVFAMFVDDISYEMPGNETTHLEVTGYRIYIDDELVAEIGASDTHFNTPELAFGSHSLNVTALYGPDKLESPASNTPKVLTVIDEVTLNKDLINSDVVVYDAAGKVVGEGSKAASRLSQGIYIVKDKQTGKARSVVFR